MADLNRTLSPLETIAAARLRNAGAPHEAPPASDRAATLGLLSWASDQSYPVRVAAGVACQCAYIRHHVSIIRKTAGDSEKVAALTGAMVGEVTKLAEWGAVLRLLEYGAVVEIDHLEEVFPAVLSAQSIRAGGSKGGRQTKRRRWAEKAAAMVSSWDELPTSGSPLEFEDLLVCVYRDGDTLCAADIDDMDAEPKTLKRSTFEKRYLNK